MSGYINGVKELVLHELFETIFVRSWDMLLYRYNEENHNATWVLIRDNRFMKNIEGIRYPFVFHL